MKFTKAQILNFEAFLARFINSSNNAMGLLQILSQFKNDKLKPEDAIKAIEDHFAKNSDGGLSWGLGRNSVIFKNVIKTTHEELSLADPSEEMKKYEEARVKYLTENEKVSDAEKSLKVDALMDEFKVREELNDRVAKLNEILNEEVEVNAFRINRNKVSGMRDGDDPSKCVLTARDSAYLQDLGILYDPSDEVVEKD